MTRYVDKTICFFFTLISEARITFTSKEQNTLLKVMKLLVETASVTHGGGYYTRYDKELANGYNSF